MFLSDNYVHGLASKYLPRTFDSGSGEKYFGAVLQAIEVVGVAGTMAYMNNKHGAPGRGAVEVMGVPVDLALGLLFSGLAVTGYFGEHSKHSLGVGCGFLAAYAVRLGSNWGQIAHQEKALASPPPLHALAGGGNFMTPSETQPVRYPWAA